eukprot:scaffold9731_cov113-Isochrysis_galbana.AAC.4
MPSGPSPAEMSTETAECTPRQPYGCSPHWIVTEAWKNSAHAVERTMAPRQLFLPPMEDDLHHPEPGIGLKASPAFQSRQELDTGAIARPRERLWYSLAWPCALACTAGTCLGKWPESARACRSWQGKRVLQRRLFF